MDVCALTLHCTYSSPDLGFNFPHTTHFSVISPSQSPFSHLIYFNYCMLSLVTSHCFWKWLLLEYGYDGFWRNESRQAAQCNPSHHQQQLNYQQSNPTHVAYTLYPIHTSRSRWEIKQANKQTRVYDEWGCDASTRQAFPAFLFKRDAFALLAWGLDFLLCMYGVCIRGCWWVVLWRVVDIPARLYVHTE